MNKIKAAVIQMHTCQDKAENLKRAASFIGQAARQGADIAILPEMFNCPYETGNFPVYAEPECGESFLRLSAEAGKAGMYVIGGSVPEIDEEGRVYNTSYAFDRNGALIGKHRKMHLFDIDVKGGQRFRESDTLTPGDSITVIDTEFGKIGLSICYDIRFPEMFRLMTEKGAVMAVCPAAFNMTTGPAHWELLFRSRAVDNQLFTIGAAPARDVNASYISYANSIIVSPWGEVVLRMDEKEGISVAELDLSLISQVREQIPVLKQRRKDIYQLKENRE